MAGDLEELRLPDGVSETTVRILAIDTISVPCRARVKRMDSGEVLVVQMLPKDEGRCAEGGGAGAAEEQQQSSSSTSTAMQSSWRGSFRRLLDKLGFSRS